MAITIGSVMDKDGREIIEIFNHYIKHGFAAFPEKQFPVEAFALFTDMVQGLPFIAAKDESNRLLGFALLRPFHKLPTFAHTAEFSCFIHPEFTRKGTGSKLLRYLEKSALKNGITIILAGISSLNPGSIAFHRKHGFYECGRFHDVCRKNGQYFDLIWMEKKLK